MGTRPFNDEPEGARREPAGDDCLVLDVDGGLVVSGAGMEVRPTKVVGLIVIHPDHDPIERADPRHPLIVAGTPDATSALGVAVAAAEGHPAAVMDTSFANLAPAVAHLCATAASWSPRVLDVPHQIDEEIDRLKLAALGVEIDALTPEQEEYLHSWGRGP